MIQKNTFLGDTYNLADINAALAFLKSYQGSVGTFISYRREIERFIHWCALYAKKPLNDIGRADIESFIKFVQKPPKAWIGASKPPKFLSKDGLRIPNPKWRPFIATVSKSESRDGESPDINNFALTPSSIKDLFSILQRFPYRMSLL